jgi:hypothetical protein
MSMLDYFGDLMNHEFVVESFTGEDEFGNPEYALPAGPYRGRVDRITENRGAPGAGSASVPPQDEPDSVILCPPCPVSVRDRVEISVPEHAAGLKFAVYRVQQEFDEAELYYLEISLRLERP